MDKSQFDMFRKLNNKMLRSIVTFCKDITKETQKAQKEMDKTLAMWFNLDPRSLKKHTAEEQELKPKLDSPSGDKDVIKDTLLELADPQKLRSGFGILCEYCESEGKDSCKCTPAGDCTFCCFCKDRSNCQRGNRIPQDCKLLEELCRILYDIKMLAYASFPIKYVLPLEDGLLAETLDAYRGMLKEALGEEINLDIISCIIQYSYLYEFKDCIPPKQYRQQLEYDDLKGVRDEKDLSTFYEHKIRSLGISRMMRAEALEYALDRIVCNPIDDDQNKLWNICNEFENELLRAQKRAPRKGSVDDLFEHAKDKISLNDILMFVRHFIDIDAYPLRTIDIKILQKCLCWKDYSFFEFIKKLTPEAE